MASRREDRRLVIPLYGAPKPGPVTSGCAWASELQLEDELETILGIPLLPGSVKAEPADEVERPLVVGRYAGAEAAHAVDPCCPVERRTHGLDGVSVAARPRQEGIADLGRAGFVRRAVEVQVADHAPPLTGAGGTQHDGAQQPRGGGRAPPG